MKKECTTTNCNTLRNTLHYNNTIQYNNNDTVVFSIRVPRYVRDYFKENGLSFSKILLDFYYHQRENQIRKLQEEIQELENCVTNKRIKVTQLMSQVTQNNDICNTLLDTFKQQGRDINNPTQQDRFWIKSQLENNSIQNMSVTSFIDYCKQKKEK